MVPEFDLFWLVIVLGLVVAAIRQATKQAVTRGDRDRWQQAAERLGLAMSGSAHKGLGMSGASGEMEVRVFARRGSEEGSKTRTHYEVALPPLGVGISVSPAASWGGLLSALGSADIEIGEPTFDGRFLVKSDYPDRARRYLTRERMAALTSLSDQHPGFVFSDDELRFQTPGVAPDTDTIVSTVSHLLTAARMLVMDQAEADRVLLGDWVADALDDDRDVEEAIPPSEPAPPDDRSEAPTERSASLDAHPEAIGGSAPIASDVDPARVAARLFGDRRLVFETEQIFTEEYLGMPVAWSGRVKRPAGLMATRAFDGDDLQVLVIEVASLEDDLYGATAIDAIVAFSGSAAPGTGDTVRFTGRLIGVDGVSKDLFVADGRLT